MDVSKRLYSVVGGMLFVVMLLLLPSYSQAATLTDCGFTRTIEDGVDGEDVRCLQRYLNATGFQIAETGPGAPGAETSLYRLLTKEAVIKWQQAKGVTPASGVFGEKSKAAYLLDLAQQLKSQVSATTPATLPTPVPQPIVAGASTDAKSVAQQDAEKAIAATMKMITGTQKQLADLRDSNQKKADKIEDDLHDTITDLFSAITKYFAGDFAGAEKIANGTLEDVTGVYEDAGGESDKSKAEDALDDAEDLYDEIEALLQDAEDEDVEVGDAPTFFKKAGALLDDAWTEFDDGGYRQAISNALDAEELLADARDEIDVVSDTDAESYVEDVWDMYDDAEEEIADAEDDGDDVDDAWDLLSDAERTLKKADLAVDDEDYSEANDLAEDAESLIEDALDAIGGGGGDETDAEDTLADAWKEYKKIKSEVSDAEDDGDDMDDAWDYLDEAKDLLDEADDAFDDEDYDEVMDLVDEALDLITDAEDEL